MSDTCTEPMIKLIKFLTGLHILQSNGSKFSKYAVSPMCLLCHTVPEDLKHLLLDCSKLQPVRRMSLKSGNPSCRQSLMVLSTCSQSGCVCPSWTALCNEKMQTLFFNDKAIPSDYGILQKQVIHTPSYQRWI